MARVKDMEGVVEGLQTYKVETRWGKKDSFKVTIDDEEFTSFGKPDFDEGDTIEFQYKANGDYNNIEKDSIEVIKRSENPKKKKDSGKSGGKGYSKGGNGGAQFRSIPELNRIDGLKLAIENRNEPADVLDIIQDAELFFTYITEGIESETLLNASLETPVDEPKKEKKAKKGKTTKKDEVDPLDEE